MVEQKISNLLVGVRFSRPAYLKEMTGFCRSFLLVICGDEQAICIACVENRTVELCSFSRKNKRAGAETKPSDGEP